MRYEKKFGYVKKFGTKKMGTKIVGTIKNFRVRGSSTRGELDPFSETERRVTFSIKS